MSKTEWKAAAKVRFIGIVAAIESGLANIARIEERAAQECAVFEILIGMAIDSARDEFAAAKAAGVTLAKVAGIATDDWREYARGMVPGKSNGTLYRWQNAGAVAKVLGDALVPGTLVGALVPLYRLLTAAKSDEDRETAEVMIRELYAEAAEAAGTDDEGAAIAPVQADILARAEAAAPSNRSGGTSKAAEAAADDDDDDDDDDGTRGTADLTVVDAAAVESAAGPCDAIMRGILKDHEGNPLTREVLVAVMLATLRLAGEHGVSTVQAVLASK
jgi:hypothetical protein